MCREGKGGTAEVLRPCDRRAFMTCEVTQMDYIIDLCKFYRGLLANVTEVDHFMAVVCEALQ